MEHLVSTVVDAKKTGLTRLLFLGIILSSILPAVLLVIQGAIVRHILVHHHPQHIAILKKYVFAEKPKILLNK